MVTKKKKNIVVDLEKACEDAGTTIAEVCRAENIDRTVLVRWKQRTPKTLVILDKIQTRIAKFRNKQTA